MDREEYVQAYAQICENGAAAAEVLARAALPPNRDPAVCYGGKYAAMEGYFASSARRYRDETDRARELLR